MAKAHFDEARLQDLRDFITADIAAGRYHGFQLIVARHGEICLHEALGKARPDAKGPLKTSDIFSLFSTTKAFTNVLALRWMELGRFQFNTRVVEIIPEWKGGLREKINVYDLITHSSGLPSVFAPKPNMKIDVFEEMIAAICENVHADMPVGEKISYSPLVSQALIGEMVRRTDPKKRRWRDIAQDDLFGPLGMKDTAFGVRPHLQARHNPPVFMPDFPPMQHLGHTKPGDNGAFEEPDAEMPWVGAISTTGDLYRFGEMLRRGGELDGVRILSPATLERALTNHTGEKPNELYSGLHVEHGGRPVPAYIGLGVLLRGTAICPHQFGVLASPGTFGNHGAGSTVYWVDPAKGITFAGISAGVINEYDNIFRFQRISDLVHAAAV